MTTQLDPAEEAVNVVPETEQEPDTTEYEIAPVPEPPDDVSVKPTPNVPEVDVTESTA